jgi:hypothetical protein
MQLTIQKAVPKLKWLDAGFPPQWPGFHPGPGQVGFVADKVALGLVSPANLHSTKFSIIIIAQDRLQ